MDIERHAVIDDETNKVANVVLWDGNKKTWQPPSGHSTVKLDNEPVSPGDQYDPEGKSFVQAEPSEATEKSDIEERIDELSAELETLKAEIS